MDSFWGKLCSSSLLLGLFFGLVPFATHASPPVRERIKNSEYRFKASVDPLVLDDRMTEIWAAVTRPAFLKKEKTYPVIVMLHGNHQTCGMPHPSGYRVDHSCEYTETGTCSDGTVVAPSHLGYSYLTQQLASLGYIVVSINSNRGINCGFEIEGDPGLNLARGRLILRHLQLLSQWNQGIEPTPRELGVSLKGKLDLKNIGLFGHSRGGEGVRAAYALYRDAKSPWREMIPDRLKFKAIFELGAVDGQTHRVLDALDVPWVQLTPSCDGDVRLLDGLKPFDRMMDNGHAEALPSLKSIFYVHGANHNFFNTEWHRSDAVGCITHPPIYQYNPDPEEGPDGLPVYHYFGNSPQQRAIATQAVTALMLGNVRSENLDPEYNRLFDPSYPLSRRLSSLTRIERAHLSTPHAGINPVLENFSGESGLSMREIPNDHSDVKVEHGTDPYLVDQVIRTAIITWTRRSNLTYFQNNWAKEGEGVDLRSHRTLSFRIARRPLSMNDVYADAGISLMDFRGRLSQEIRLAKVVAVLEPGGYGLAHPVLQTAKVPLAWFKGVDLGQIRGIRFTFNGSKSGTLLLDEIRLHSEPGEIGELRGSLGFLGARAGAESVPAKTARIEKIQARQNPRNGAQESEVVIRSSEAFPVGGSLLVLDMDGVESKRSFFPNPKDLREVAFRISPEQANRVRGARKIELKLGSETLYRIEK